VSGRRLLVGLLVVFLVAVIPAVVLPTPLCRAEHQAMPDPAPTQPLAPLDALGRPVTHRALRGPRPLKVPHPILGADHHRRRPPKAQGGSFFFSSPHKFYFFFFAL